MTFKQVWTAEMVTRARDLRRAGETAGVISEVLLSEFNVSFTVVAINNKMRRTEYRGPQKRAFRRKSTWSPEQEKVLRQLIEEGHTYSETAQILSFQFRTSFSRSRVAGRIYLLGIKVPERKPRARVPQEQKPCARKPRRPKIEAPKDEPISRGIPLEALGHNECHWPHGDSYPYAYCGHPVLPGSSYCAYHHVLAHTTPEEDAGK